VERDRLKLAEVPPPVAAYAVTVVLPVMVTVADPGVAASL